jgi:hypothetical protein
MRPWLLSLLLVLTAPAAAQAAPLTIRTDEHAVTRIGSFRPGSNATIAAARRAFGRPSSTRFEGEGCRVDWDQLRLRIFFANFGALPPGGDVCDRRVGKAQLFRVRGARFQTWRGLRVGQRSADIRARHPGARFRDGTWWLRTGINRAGDPAEYAVLRALVAGGRIRALSGWIGAAGD